MSSDAKAALLKLAAEHPELADKILIAGGWVPGELKDDTYDTGHIEEREVPEPGVGEGSHVPPARNSKGELIEKYDHAMAESWAKAAKKKA